MDLATRGVGALETVRRLRAGEAGVPDPEVPVVGLISAGRIDVRGHALAVGMNDVAVKPPGQDQLEILIARWAQGPAPASRRGDG
jgi:CheY-like chemotaxis protein